MKLAQIFCNHSVLRPDGGEYICNKCDKKMDSNWVQKKYLEGVYHKFKDHKWIK